MRWTQGVIAGLFIVLWLPLRAWAVGDFALLDQNGDFHQLSRYRDRQAVVIYMHQPSCPVSTAELERFAVMRERFRGESVAFFVLVTEPDASREEMRATMQSLSSDLDVLMDTSQLVASTLPFERAAEAVVIDPARMELLYHGAFDRRSPHHSQGRDAQQREPHLHGVVEALIEGRPVPDQAPESAGQPLELSSLVALQDDPPSYSQDVVPILERHCISCHREGGSAPWAMDSHRAVQGWSSMIRETLMTRRMPPGQIDPQHVDRFVDLHHISDEEMARLVTWIDNGARRDGEQDPLKNIEPRESEWALGEPDLVVNFPPQEIPATGVIDYRFVPVEIGLSEERWVRAYEFNIGNEAALHHVIAYTQDARQQRQNSSRGGSRTNFGGYAPGREYVLFDEDTGIRLTRDMRFMIQFHYTTIGRALTDQTSIGLYFHDEPPERSLTRTAVMNGDFVIPPGVSDHQVVGTAVIDDDSYLHSFAPHMHFRGKYIHFHAEYPDGQRENLLSIPNFQHNWQMVYSLREPFFLPAGTTIIAEGGFDNSALNPLNPDPRQSVRWGDQVWDEMFITWMRISSASRE